MAYYFLVLLIRLHLALHDKLAKFVTKLGSHQKLSFDFVRVFSEASGEAIFSPALLMNIDSMDSRNLKRLKT